MLWIWLFSFSNFRFCGVVLASGYLGVFEVFFLHMYLDLAKQKTKIWRDIRSWIRFEGFYGVLESIVYKDEINLVPNDFLGVSAGEFMTVRENLLSFTSRPSWPVSVPTSIYATTGTAFWITVIEPLHQLQGDDSLSRNNNIT